MQCQCGGTPASAPRGRHCSTRRRPPSDRHPARWPAAGGLQGKAVGGLCWHCRRLSRTLAAPLKRSCFSPTPIVQRLQQRRVHKPPASSMAATNQPVLRRTAFMRTLSSPSCPSFTLKLQQWAASGTGHRGEGLLGHEAAGCRLHSSICLEPFFSAACSSSTARHTTASHHRTKRAVPLPAVMHSS